MAGSALLLAAAIAAMLIFSAHAQTPEQVVREIRFDQRLDGALPLEATFIDESGRRVRVGEYFGSRPVILALVYYECPLLCNQMLNGLTRCLKTMNLNPGSDFEVVVVSFDPTEKPELAALKKQAYMRAYDRPGTEAGWHFLTGEREPIRTLCESVGFRYVYDSASGQYAHASGIVVATPDGRIARYFFGLEFLPRDVRLGLVEASAGKIGTVADQIMLYCYSYNAIEGKYGFAIMSVIRGFGLLTLLFIATFIAIHVRRERNTRTKTSIIRITPINPTPFVETPDRLPNGGGGRDAHPTNGGRA
ncbi:MAG TPA: SCO family protein [Planctomycetota bacterium]|nr:SCO family protein [Planctomycetota bacterium]